MKLINNKRYTVLVFLGLINIMIGLAEMLKIIPHSGTTTPGVSMIGAGIIILIIGLYLSRTPESDSMPDELESDERTQKIAGKAAQNTIVVIIVTLAVIGWGHILDLFKLETLAVVSVVFFALMISMIGFLKYYNSKDIQA